MSNYDFITETNKEEVVCPSCKVKYTKHAWSPGGKCPKCSNNVKD